MVNPSVKCTDGKYLKFKWGVVCLSVILPFGIVAFYFYELLLYRKVLCPSVCRPEGVADTDLAEIPRAVLGLDTQQRQPLPSQPRQPMLSRKSFQQFAHTVLKLEKEIGVSRAELALAFNNRRASKGNKYAREWLRMVVRDARKEAPHLEFLYAAYRPQYYWFEAFEM